MGNLDSGVTGGEFGTEEIREGEVVVAVGLRFEGGGETGAVPLVVPLFNRR
jgi:hypothetical protein